MVDWLRLGGSVGGSEFRRTVGRGLRHSVRSFGSFGFIGFVSLGSFVAFLGFVRCFVGFLGGLVTAVGLVGVDESLERTFAFSRHSVRLFGRFRCSSVGSFDSFVAFVSFVGFVRFGSTVSCFRS